MKDEENKLVTQNNRVIAEFMGYYVFNVINPQPLPASYQKSWELLIPVWHKLITAIWDKGMFDLPESVELYSAFNTRIARNAPGEATQILAVAITAYKNHN